MMVGDWKILGAKAAQAILAAFSNPHQDQKNILVPRRFTFAGRPLIIATSGDELGRETQWHIDALPVAVLAAQVGGPSALLTTETADVHVVDRWRRSDDEHFIVMDWSVVLHDVWAELPEAPSPLLALLGGPAVRCINQQSGSIPLSFQVVIDENRFHGAGSAEAAGVW